MERHEAELLINNAIDQLIESDRQLLELNVAERALSFRLAHYMLTSGAVPKPATVDCEYNRDGLDPKRLQLPDRHTTSSDLKATTVFPDIIVHQRNSSDRNLLVIEMKKDPTVEEFDFDGMKLRAFKHDLGYRHAAHLILRINAAGNVHRELIWIDD